MSLNDDFGLPLAKRQKFDVESPSTRLTSSRLFAPFRTIGLVSSTSVPFTSIPLGKTTFQITTSVGRSLQTYDLRRGLNLVFLSRPQCPETITATCAYRDKVFVAWGNERPGTRRGVWVVKRGRFVGRLATDDTICQQIDSLLVFGTWIVGCGSKAIEVWRNDTFQHYTTILPNLNHTYNKEIGFTGQICTLPTFLNKVFVGQQDGSVGIYNISTGKAVHILPPPSPSCGRVTAVAPTLAVGVLAVAHLDGSIALIDVELDEVVIQLQQSNAACPVCCITFRSDGAGAGEDGRQDGIMATSSLHSGDITMWDLNRGGRVVGVLRSAHEVSSIPASGINKIEFLAGQPVIVSSGLDNSLRSWIFDQTPFSPVPRLLHSRSGHAAPVSSLEFLPAASDGSEAASKWILSAGQDRSFWGFSLRKDGQSTELSQGNVKHKAKKLGNLSDNTSAIEDFKAAPITAIACSLNRDGGMGAVGGPVWANLKAGNAEESNMTGWESVVTAHQDDRFARTWFWGRKKAGRWAFGSSDSKPVTSVATTACGTFALVGSAGGSLDMYNLQSGIHRQRFPPRLKPAQAKQLRLHQAQSGQAVRTQRGHSDRITGIVVDNLNRNVVSTSLDGNAIFWGFSSGGVIDTISFQAGAPISMRYNSVSGLVAIACDDLCIRIVDIETRRTVRELLGCVGQIYDHCFSHDGRWIIACSMDSVVRTFDLATGHVVDAFKIATCTNVAFSSTGEFLATAHAGSIGINIWNNKSLFTNIPLRQIDDEDGIIDLTDNAEFEAISQLAIQNTADDMDVILDERSSATAVDQLDKSLLTLSLMSSSKWQTLLNLDAIRDRNKPIQPPEKPKAAPFFLKSSLANGTTPGTPEDSVADQQPPATTSQAERSHISRLASIAPNSTKISALIDDFTNRDEPDPSDIITHLMLLSPSAADLEIRSLTLNEMVGFVLALTARLRQRRDFELVNTWMNVFLKVHAEFISEIDGIRKAVFEFKQVMDQEAKRLSALVGWGRSVVDFLRSAR